MYLLRITCLSLLCCFQIAQAQTLDIRTFGAIGDGQTLNTRAIQAAIDSCNAQGGGQVLIPPGIFITGTLQLKSRVHLYLSNGAVLKGSPRLEDYALHIPAAPYSPVRKGIFYSENVEDVILSGPGQIHGNGDRFFDHTKAKRIEGEGWGGAAFTRQKSQYRQVTQGIGDGPIVPLGRPYQMICFSNSRRITIKEVFIYQAPFWALHFADCDGVSVEHIRLYTNMLAPNADGIDITSCANVIVNGCDIRSGDDAIAITGYAKHFEIPGFTGSRTSCENIIISNCNLQSYSSGIRIGFLDQHTVRNVHVSNCNITNSTRGIGIFVRDSGSVENLKFVNIHIETRLRTGDWWGNGEPIHLSAVPGTPSGKLGKIKHVDFTNITCQAENGILVYGSPESTIEDLHFHNLFLKMQESPLNAVAGGNIDLRGAIGDKQIFESPIPGFLGRYIKGLTLDGYALDWGSASADFFTSALELFQVRELDITRFKGRAAPFSNAPDIDIHALQNGTIRPIPFQLKNGTVYVKSALLK